MIYIKKTYKLECQDGSYIEVEATSSGDYPVVMHSPNGNATVMQMFSSISAATKYLDDLTGRIAHERNVVVHID